MSLQVGLFAKFGLWSFSYECIFPGCSFHPVVDCQFRCNVLVVFGQSEIGKVSKNILDRINSTTAKKHNLYQWKNTPAVIDWFKSIKNKERFSFICFDIEEFYPSISQDLLITALDFASDYDHRRKKHYNPR